MRSLKEDRLAEILANEMRKGAARLRAEHPRDLYKQSSADFVERWADAILTGKPLDLKPPRH